MPEIQDLITDINKLQETVLELKNSENVYTLVNLVFFGAVVLFFFFLKSYIGKKAEVIAQAAAEKSLKKFQGEIDKDLVKYSTKHQKQIDAIHDTFKVFDPLNKIMNSLFDGGQFSEKNDSKKQLENLKMKRDEFKQVFDENRLIFSRPLCAKIDDALNIIDDYIQAFKDGIIHPTHRFADIELLQDGKKIGNVEGMWLANVFNDF
jgi:hypothetical protein